MKQFNNLVIILFLLINLTLLTNSANSANQTDRNITIQTSVEK